MALVDAINRAQAERAAAEAKLASLPKVAVISDADIHTMIDSLGDVGAALDGRKPDDLSQLYERLLWLTTGGHDAPFMGRRSTG